MIFIISVLIVLIGLQHFLFMILETYYWTKPLGMKVFHLNQSQAEAQKILASNQGIYNGFIGAGLIWAVLHPNPDFSEQLMIFFLTCVVIAGIWGGMTFSKRIIWVQAMPAILSLVLLLFI